MRAPDADGHVNHPCPRLRQAQLDSCATQQRQSTYWPPGSPGSWHGTVVPCTCTVPLPYGNITTWHSGFAGALCVMSAPVHVLGKPKSEAACMCHPTSGRSRHASCRVRRACIFGEPQQTGPNAGSRARKLGISGGALSPRGAAYGPRITPSTLFRGFLDAVGENVVRALLASGSDLPLEDVSPARKTV